MIRRYTVRPLASHGNRVVGTGARRPSRPRENVVAGAPNSHAVLSMRTSRCEEPQVWRTLPTQVNHWRNAERLAAPRSAVRGPRAACRVPRAACRGSGNGDGCCHACWSIQLFWCQTIATERWTLTMRVMLTRSPVQTCQFGNPTGRICEGRRRILGRRHHG